MGLISRYRDSVAFIRISSLQLRWCLLPLSDTIYSPHFSLRGLDKVAPIHTVMSLATPPFSGRLASSLRHWTAGSSLAVDGYLARLTRRPTAEGGDA